MRTTLKLVISAVSTTVLFYISCQKEISCESCQANPTSKANKPPIAIAGSDQIIALPTDSVSLDGTISSDPDGTINEWLWKKILGPASFNIVSSSTAKTVVRSLDTGVYRFELKVTDDGNLSTTDTVQIAVTGSGQPNRPPVANAGEDQTITLPINSVNLDGSVSTDPDSNISSYLWTKISGPTSFNITNVNSVQTQVTDLTEGIYQFELKITDAGGLFSKDTMLVDVNVNAAPECDNSNRPTINAQLVSIATLSGVPWAVAYAGSKLVFAIPGAVNNVNDLTLDIYDLTVHTWSTKFWNFSRPLAVFDEFPTVIGVGNKVLFAGGEADILTLDVVQIYDVSDDSWSVSHLSAPGALFSATTCGEKAFFASGFEHDPGRVDIYSATTDSWSTTSLSVPRFGVTSVSGNNKVYFAGGLSLMPGNSVSNVIDIYDNATNTWSTSAMQFPRFFHAGVSVNDILYFGGGSNILPYSQNNPAICTVETLNTITSDRSLMDLFKPAAWQTYDGQNAVHKQNKIIFLRQQGGVDTNRFDVYDTQSNTWSIGILPEALPSGAIAISVNNTIYIVGGYQNTQVWKLEF